MTGNSPSTIKVDTGQIPDVIRESIGNTMYRSFMEAIRDPDAKRRFDELGAAFMKRVGLTEPT